MKWLSRIDSFASICSLLEFEKRTLFLKKKNFVFPNSRGGISKEFFFPIGAGPNRGLSALSLLVKHKNPLLQFFSDRDYLGTIPY